MSGLLRGGHGKCTAFEQLEFNKLGVNTDESALLSSDMIWDIGSGNIADQVISRRDGTMRNAQHITSLAYERRYDQHLGRAVARSKRRRCCHAW